MAFGEINVLSEEAIGLINTILGDPNYGGGMDLRGSLNKSLTNVVQTFDNISKNIEETLTPSKVAKDNISSAYDEISKKIKNIKFNVDANMDLTSLFMADKDTAKKIKLEYENLLINTLKNIKNDVGKVKIVEGEINFSKMFNVDISQDNKLKNQYTALISNVLTKLTLYFNKMDFMKMITFDDKLSLSMLFRAPENFKMMGMIQLKYNLLLYKIFSRVNESLSSKKFDFDNNLKLKDIFSVPQDLSSSVLKKYNKVIGNLLDKIQSAIKEIDIGKLQESITKNINVNIGSRGLGGGVGGSKVFEQEVPQVMVTEFSEKAVEQLGGYIGKEKAEAAKKSRMEGIADRIKEGAGGIWDWIKHHIPGILMLLAGGAFIAANWDLIKKWWDDSGLGKIWKEKMQPLFEEAWENFKTIGEKVVTKIGDFVGNTLKAAFKSAWEVIKDHPLTAIAVGALITAIASPTVALLSASAIASGLMWNPIVAIPIVALLALMALTEEQNKQSKLSDKKNKMSGTFTNELEKINDESRKKYSDEQWKALTAKEKRNISNENIKKASENLTVPERKKEIQKSLKMSDSEFDEGMIDAVSTSRNMANKGYLESKDPTGSATYQYEKTNKDKFEEISSLFFDGRNPAELAKLLNSLSVDRLMDIVGYGNKEMDSWGVTGTGTRKTLKPFLYNVIRQKQNKMLTPDELNFPIGQTGKVDNPGVNVSNMFAPETDQKQYTDNMTYKDFSVKYLTPQKDMISYYKDGELTIQPVSQRDQFETYSTESGGVIDSGFKEMFDGIKNMDVSINRLTSSLSKELKTLSNNRGQSEDRGKSNMGSGGSMSTNIPPTAERDIRSAAYDVIYNHRINVYNRFMEFA